MRLDLVTFSFDSEPRLPELELAVLLPSEVVLSLPITLLLFDALAEPLTDSPLTSFLETVEPPDLLCPYW